MSENQPEKIASEIKKIVKGDVYSDIFHRIAYSIDASIYRIVPECIVIPADAEDVSAVVKYCGKEGVPVVARGAGSGVAGECLSGGVVLDMRTSMNKILEIDDSGEFAVCQPGVVLSDLNDRLREYGMKIGPDPSSGNRATLGGVVANNATGAHSLQYGYIADYVERLEVVLSDGTICNIVNDYEPSKADTLKDNSGRDCIELLNENENIIQKATLQSKRNRSGYNITEICHNGKIDMARLFAGSEGTLGIITKIKLRTAALPSVSAVVQFEFDSLHNMAKAVPKIVDSGAAACELMDETLIKMALESLPEYRDILSGNAAAVLCVEHNGNNKQQVERKIEATDTAVGKLASSRRIIFDLAQQEKLAKARKDAVPLLYRVNSKRKPVPFIEDISVDNSRLDEYITGLKDIGIKNDTKMVFYGHAGDGELHVRPYLDLGRDDDVERMQKIAEQAFTLAWSLGGTISGEHGEGLVRAGFLRRQYGDEFYGILCRIKKIFDPNSILNPGKILNDDADIMIKNLKSAQKISKKRIENSLNFKENELEIELEKCNGCGLCLSRESDLRMCPVFRATGDEMFSSRVKANLLRYWAGGGFDESILKSKEFSRILSLCVNCKACALQCPSGVDISKLIIAARTQIAEQQGVGIAQKFLSYNRYLSMAASPFAPLANFVMSVKPFKWFLEKTAGLDSSRNMPSFQMGTFLRKGRKYLKKHGEIEKPQDKVVYFTDTFANYNDHSLGLAVLKVLRYNDIDIQLPNQRPAPVPAMYYGNQKVARKDLTYSSEFLIESVKNGRKIICSEPSAALCLKQELRHYIDSETAEQLSANTYELMEYLRDLYEEDKLKPPVKEQNGKYAYHQPCHLFALGIGQPGVDVLKDRFNINIIPLNAGCCGLAGTFGMQKKNSALSQAISENLRRELGRKNYETVITECSVCAMQIEHISRSKTQHPIKLIEKAYGI